MSLRQTLQRLLAVALLLLPVALTHAWVQNNGYSWPSGSTVSMRLQLTRSSVNFLDGSSSWNAVAASALAIWNQHLDTLQFAEAPASSTGPGDGQNSVFFSSTVYGESFGNAIAVTVGWNDAANPKSIVETDVIFSTAQQWNSYRGTTRFDSRGNPIYDLRRVALHEFGHVLGLGHPDESGQYVHAVMNAHASDFDNLTADDIAGGRHLYGFRITSSTTPPAVVAGAEFSYQITATGNPTSYSASALPPGLQIDGATGRIFGVPAAAGDFSVTVFAHGPVRTVSATIRIVISAPVITSSRNPPPLAVDEECRYQITASHHATSFEATGLPPGLTLDTTSGLISGLATTVGNYTTTVIARSPSASATAQIFFTVAGPAITSNLYPPPVAIGSAFNYTITASNNPRSFSAFDLPAGLQLDPLTGVISGIATVSGSFRVTVTAHGRRDATALLWISVSALPPPDGAVATFSGVYGGIAADPVRPRLYFVSQSSLQVLDSDTLSIVSSLPGSGFVDDMMVSADGSRLWMVSYQALMRVDLNSLTRLPNVTTADHLYRIREGSGGRLYATTMYYSTNGVIQLDADTGAVRARFSPVTYSASAQSLPIEVSSDRKTLYVGASNYPTSTAATIARYDISTVNATLVQSATQQNFAAAGLALSGDGSQIALVPLSGSVTPIRSTADLNVSTGSLSWDRRSSITVFSADGALGFVAGRDSPSIAVFDARTHRLLRMIDRTGQGEPSRMVVDAANKHLFVTASDGKLQVYRVHPPRPPAARPKSLLNVSTRLRSGTADDALIGGFIVTGEGEKKVVVRAIGPSLPMAGKLGDPALELRNSAGDLIAANDNWNSHRADVLQTGLAPAHERESVIIANLQPGSYTASVSSVHGTGGVALVEVYDLASHTGAKLANISTRGHVKIGDDVMIGGFIVGGDQPTRLIVRAIGPSLAASGVSDALADTTLDLHDANGTVIAHNNDWRSDHEQEIEATTIPPGDARESAIVQTLQPGNYTAVVRGSNNTTGVALVEVYNLDTACDVAIATVPVASTSGR